MTTVEMKLNLLAPARSGKLIAEGRRIKLGQTLGLGEARVEDEKGRLLAHGTGTFMIVPGQAAHESLPPKFLDDLRKASGREK
jgi:acyl-coenzyme A thioesterase PaaI-like protein